jgi:hypothetical protein
MNNRIFLIFKAIKYKYVPTVPFNSIIDSDPFKKYLLYSSPGAGHRGRRGRYCPEITPGVLNFEPINILLAARSPVTP